MEKGIVYYTDNQLDKDTERLCRNFIAMSGLPITSSSLKPIDFGDNNVVNGKRGYTTMLKQIVDALERSKSEVIFFCEHDVIYHPSHFKFTPPRKDTFYYNKNKVKWKPDTNEIVSYDSKILSQGCAHRELALEHYRNMVKRGKDHKTEAEYHLPTEYFESELPNIDIRHDKNLTGNKRLKYEDFNKKPDNFITLKELPWSFQI